MPTTINRRAHHFLLMTIVCLAWAMSATMAMAELRVTDAVGESRHYSFAELDALIGTTERQIPDDYLFKTEKTYLGYDLNKLFDVLSLPRDQHYLLVCTDGYEIEFDARHLNDERFKPLLARADVDAGDAVWLPYKVGVNPAALSPFYLAWAADSDEAQTEARATLPWPYALNEIRFHDPEGLHAAAHPGKNAPSDVLHGFELFTAHCMKCHKINESGGSLGPELTTSPAVTFTTDEQLADVIANIKTYYPSSKMPTYVKSLTPEEMDATVTYLRHVNREALQP